MSTQPNQTDLSEIIADNFGANATYVESLLQRFRSDPSLVDESWRAYFGELLGDSAASDENGDAATAAASPTTTPNKADGNGATAATTTRAAGPMKAATQSAATAAPAPAPNAAPAATAAQPAAAPSDAAPIRGAALKIVENMETSLSVPTATSNRQVP
ncbi:MAG: multifunctional oxoglutarate decarboxylase/oxoglutarate dehydrogenase thiamine pyrophosphate-binding subunit/dihydrolipoyllysine-residue succinyltransferase subunit, partial [Pyrinomonadaceae bacterium]|nr:multifunctional oxoglutarate decarboxylase/oxoglutarate dehydrogenase thiamine pyrophosphate-binding subunit/dihydrolipoyllysine-residue succinyltransferase subunit [Pyrinomonadaceae bacterium]